MEYWQKIDAPSKEIKEILEWGTPEQKTGNLLIVGGNVQNFSTEIRNAEFLSAKPLKRAQLLLPDALRNKIPPLPNVSFAASTEAGSFAQSDTLNEFFADSDFVFVSGDVSKNSATALALTSALKSTLAPTLLTRDAVDLLVEGAGDFIEDHPVFFVASMAQLQKLFRALLYPKMLLLGQPLMPVVETLHKFTLSYANVTILTFHQDQIIIASNGEVITVPIVATNYSPISLWAGTLASKISALNLWNSNRPLAATAAAVFWETR